MNDIVEEEWYELFEPSIDIRNYLISENYHRYNNFIFVHLENRTWARIDERINVTVLWFQKNKEIKQ